MIHYRIGKKTGALVVAAALGFLLLAQSTFGQNSVTINVNGAVNVIPKEMYGALMERLGRQWGNGTNGGIWVGTTSQAIPNTNGMRNDVIAALKDCGLGAAQWPGGCAAWGYKWTPPNPSNDVGTDRFLEFCQLIGCEPVICGPHYSNSAASNLAWVKHIDSVTAKRGMDSLKWFKIGNEVWGGCGAGMDAATYSTNADPSATALRNYRSSLKLEICGPNEEVSTDSVYRWFNTLSTRLGTKVDGIEYHDYTFRTTWNSLTFTIPQYWQIMADGTICDFAHHMRTNIIPGMDRIDPAKRIKIVVDEWGDWMAGDNWLQTATLMDALSAANQLHLMMSFSDRIGVACIAQGVSVIHSLVNINTSSVMTRTPTFYVFKMFKPHRTNGAKWAPITASTIQTTTQSVGLTTWGTPSNREIPLMTVGSTVDAGGRVNISVSNIDLTATRQITVNLTSNQAEYAIDSAQIVTGPAMNSNNPYGGAEVVNLQNFAASNYTLSNSGKTVTATLPARSIVMFRLKPVGTATIGIRDGKTVAGGIVSIKAGTGGKVLISSSGAQNTPFSTTLYGLDGRTMLDRFSGTLEPGKSMVWQPAVKNRGANVYVVKIKTGEVARSQRIIF